MVLLVLFPALPGHEIDTFNDLTLVFNENVLIQYGHVPYFRMDSAHPVDRNLPVPKEGSECNPRISTAIVQYSDPHVGNEAIAIAMR